MRPFGSSYLRFALPLFGAALLTATSPASAQESPAAPPNAPPPPPAAAAPPPPSFPPVATRTVVLTPLPTVVAVQPSAPPPEDLSPLAFRADFKLPFTVSSLFSNQGTDVSGLSSSPFAAVPQLTLGVHFGRVGIGLGFGFTRIGLSSPELGFSGGSSGSISSSIADIMFAPTLTVDVFRSDDGKVAFYVLGAPILGAVIATNASTDTDFGFQFALGANVALHQNFRLGLEVGPIAHFFSESNGDTVSDVALYTGLVGSFLYPR